jgi:streptogramin lyase
MGAASGATETPTVDLSPTSSACSTTAAGRTCTATALAPLDNDTFTITLYDTAPVNGTIPASAHVLGVGVQTANVTQGFTGTIGVSVGGQVAGLAVKPAFSSTPADGNAHTIALYFEAGDAAGNTIVTSSGAPYANPITVTLTESGGSGHSSLVVNGTASGTSATIQQSGTTLAIAYDGGGSSGYQASIAFSATGIATQTVQFSPMYVTVPTGYLSGSNISLYGSQTALSIAVSEAGAPATLSYNAILSAPCTGLASASSVTTSAGAGTFTLTGGSGAGTASAGCTLSVTDSNANTISYTIANTLTTGSLPLPGESAVSYSTTIQPGVALLAPDGTVWFSDASAGGFARVTTAGTSSAYSGPVWAGLADGSDGNVYAIYSSYVYRIPLASPATSYAVASLSLSAQAIVAGSDGNLWISEYQSGYTGNVDRVSIGGAITSYNVPAVIGPAPVLQGIAQGPGGILYMCDSEVPNRIISLNEALPPATAFASVVTLPSTSCNQVAVQGDGKALWITTNATNVLKYDLTTSTLSTVTLTGRSDGVTAGADNAMYVDETSGATGIIARIPYATGTPSEFSLPSPVGTMAGIALGADGRIWAGSYATSTIWALTP